MFRRNYDIRLLDKTILHLIKEQAELYKSQFHREPDRVYLGYESYIQMQAEYNDTLDIKDDVSDSIELPIKIFPKHVEVFGLKVHILKEPRHIFVTGLIN